MKLMVYPVLAAVGLTAGCYHPRTVSLASLYGQVHLGMKRTEVETILGKPMSPITYPTPIEWYLPPPKLKPQESPAGAGSIGIIYTSAGIVRNKFLNPQSQSE